MAFIINYLKLILLLDPWSDQIRPRIKFGQNLIYIKVNGDIKLQTSNGESMMAANSAKVCELQEQLEILSRDLASAMNQANELNTR